MKYGSEMKIRAHTAKVLQEEKRRDEWEDEEEYEETEEESQDAMKHCEEIESVAKKHLRKRSKHERRQRE
jgi:hypothetical protein